MRSFKNPVNTYLVEKRIKTTQQLIKLFLKKIILNVMPATHTQQKKVGTGATKVVQSCVKKKTPGGKSHN